MGYAQRLQNEDKLSISAPLHDIIKLFEERILDLEGFTEEQYEMLTHFLLWILSQDYEDFFEEGSITEKKFFFGVYTLFRNVGKSHDLAIRIEAPDQPRDKPATPQMIQGMPASPAVAVNVSQQPTQMQEEEGGKSIISTIFGGLRRAAGRRGDGGDKDNETVFGKRIPSQTLYYAKATMRTVNDFLLYDVRLRMFLRKFKNEPEQHKQLCRFHFSLYTDHVRKMMQLIVANASASVERKIDRIMETEGDMGRESAKALTDFSPTNIEAAPQSMQMPETQRQKARIAAMRRSAMSTGSPKSKKPLQPQAQLGEKPESRDEDAASATPQAKSKPPPLDSPPAVKRKRKPAKTEEDEEGEQEGEGQSGEIAPAESLEDVFAPPKLEAKK